MRFVLAAVVVLCVGCASLLADEPGRPVEVTEDWHGVTFVRIPAGEFMMGSEESVADLARAGITVPERVAVDDEGPLHRVKISAFQMGKYELTRGQFRIFKLSKARCITGPTPVFRKRTRIRSSMFRGTMRWRIVDG